MKIIIIAAVLVAIAACIYALHRLGLYLERRGLMHYLRTPPRGGGGYNPLQELVQPQARHVVQVEEQRELGEREGGPRGGGEPEQPGEYLECGDSSPLLDGRSQRIDRLGSR